MKKIASFFPHFEGAYMHACMFLTNIGWVAVCYIVNQKSSLVSVSAYLALSKRKKNEFFIVSSFFIKSPETGDFFLKFIIQYVWEFYFVFKKILFFYFVGLAIDVCWQIAISCKVTDLFHWQSYTTHAWRVYF